MANTHYSTCTEETLESAREKLAEAGYEPSRVSDSERLILAVDADRDADDLDTIRELLGSAYSVEFCGSSNTGADGKSTEDIRIELAPVTAAARGNSDTCGHYGGVVECLAAEISEAIAKNFEGFDFSGCHQAIAEVRRLLDDLERAVLHTNDEEQTPETVAKLLAGEHLKEDRDIREIFWVPADDEVRLVEVSGSLGDTGEVLPFKFSPDPPDVPYPTVVILLGLRDWERVLAGELQLPEGWQPELERIFPPA